MSNLSNITTHPFYIYDTRKYHGYIYSPIDALYHLCDKHNIRKYISSSPNTPEVQIKDLRSVMDMANNKLSITPDLILIPSTMEYRPRCCDDYFTYSIEAPIPSTRLNTYMNKIIPVIEERILLKKFLKLALTSMVSHKLYIIISGKEQAVNVLFALLLKLEPIVKQSRPSIYCESNVNKSTLDEIHQARIVVSDIGHRTLRVADPPYDKVYQRPIQYYGLVYQDKSVITYRSRDVTERIVNIETIEDNEIIFTPGEILGWILLSID